ncbi:MAG: shikimate dehydrogenase, partial [Lachnospiraceae bacterium]|nr:shikimate dehydrogenase [Lachnospiraceae bacterium]
MDVYGLIGNPVAHSLSPVIHKTIAKELSKEIDYRLFEIKDDLSGNLSRLYEEGVLGLNVTVPYKSQVMPYLQGTDPLAEAIGAVNTLVRQDGGFYGYNTDIEGLRRELREEGISAEGRK